VAFDLDEFRGLGHRHFRQALTRPARATGGEPNSMTMTRITRLRRGAAQLLMSCAASGGSQNFLGARWVERAVGLAPTPARRRLALRLLALSPHYFYSRDLRGEHERNRQSRQFLADALVGPHLTGDMQVLDYGCGPGYLAHAVAPKAAHVDAVDISRGVLACARVLNGRPNITYQTPDELRRRDVPVDLAYSFAVVQHLRTGALAAMLSVLAGTLRSGGVILLHFAVPGPGRWRTEAEWLADRSLAGRARWRYGLNCFGRPPAELTSLVRAHGFTDVTVRALNEDLACPGDDIATQHLLTARRR
jgi:SAM-dependent methyltransferase